MWICSLHGVAQLIAGRLTASPASHKKEEHGENQILLHCLKQLVSWEFVPAVLSFCLLLSAVT